MKLLGQLLLAFLFCGYSFASEKSSGLLEKTILKTSGNQEKHNVFELENIGEITAVLETSIKLAETNFRPEENFKSGKRKLSVQLALQIVGISKSVFYTYSSKRDKSKNIFPLYISHRRLLI